MKKTSKTGVFYREGLIGDLRADDEAQLQYIKANFEENGDLHSAIFSAIRTLAEAREFKNFAEEVKLNRENLHRVLSEDGNPRLATFFKFLDGLGLRLSVEPKSKVC